MFHFLNNFSRIKQYFEVLLLSNPILTLNISRLNMESVAKTREYSLHEKLSKSLKPSASACDLDEGHSIS